MTNQGSFSGEQPPVPSASDARATSDPGRAFSNAEMLERLEAGELANAWLAAIIQSSDDAIVSKNLDGIVQSWNPAAERIFGYTAAEMIGRPIATLVPADRPDEEANILARLRRGERVDHFETVRVTKTGQHINVSVTISPIRDSSGRIVGASKVARDITERKRADIEREHLLAAERAARAEAERTSRMKDEFLATLGHELRTPLNAILGWASLLKRPHTKPDGVLSGVAVIERNARVLAQLIEDMLDMSRIVAGKVRLDVQPVELPSVILNALEAVRPAADAKEIRLHHVLDPIAGTVSGDPGRLQQVMWNLLSNAVKFTPRHGRVQIVLERINSHVEISVADSGVGISPEFLPHVFDRFRQADASTTRQHGGLGLGLAIAKHLVELHGGTIGVRSDGPGRGATFMVALPVRVVQPEVQPPRPSAPPAAEEISLVGVRVVVVDDDRDARQLIQRVLEDAGAVVSVTDSAQSGIDLVQNDPPDVLISDIGMPLEDGYSLIRRVRNLPKGRGGDVPAVALTAFARAEDRRRALLAGFQMHVAKPVEAAELLVVIASVTHRV